MRDACHKSITAQQMWHLLLTPCAVRKLIYVISPSYCLPVFLNLHAVRPTSLQNSEFHNIDLKMAFHSIALIDTQSASPPSHSQETASTDWEMAYLSSLAQATPLADLEAAHLLHESSRDPSRPPSYMEEDMAEPLPTYVDSIRRKMKQAMPYSKMRCPQSLSAFGSKSFLHSSF